jgi:hypothetical protein
MYYIKKYIYNKYTKITMYLYPFTEQVSERTQISLKTKNKKAKLKCFNNPKGD